ncbi:uncharacterized protein A1O5_08096 [Cladophialophora psammophila CBS 110553]|uniref:FAD-binding domain-containing protein n=1 Tax=Cladophialophora psammophila CBS 110553 TaxID=1182543 RepID=W9WWX5_9EURO|nr:uncharacterized protein A1O5_08096 [Cladophialophora psammophila CBS 110553]EXJ69161.1 hypothetical protein A1O5_08096 [Cladophialophora psammophila CBS 110553]
MSLQPTVIIVGAGIGGLASAVALRQAGHKIIVLERYSNKREVGFAVSLSPNANMVLRDLGVDFKSARMVYCTEEVIIQAAPAEQPFQVLWRKSLANLEEEEGAGVPVEIVEGVSAVHFDAAGSITLHNGEMLRADFIVAADGVKSKAHRVIMKDGEERPATLTVSNVRVCMPTKVLMEDKELKEFMELAPHGTSPLFTEYSNLLQNFGFYAVTDNNQPANKQKCNKQTAKQVACDHIKTFHPSLHKMLDYCDEDDMYLWKVADREPLPTYHKDHLIVLGDAAHPMLPTLGSGAGMAIEDAGALGVVMEEVKDVGEVAGRLDLWDRLRRPRASAVQLLSRTVAVEYDLSKETQDMVRQYLSEEELPDFTRACVNRMLFRYDYLGEARRAMQDMTDSAICARIKHFGAAH